MLSVFIVTLLETITLEKLSVSFQIHNYFTNLSISLLILKPNVVNIITLVTAIYIKIQTH